MAADEDNRKFNTDANDDDDAINDGQINADADGVSNADDDAKSKSDDNSNYNANDKDNAKDKANDKDIAKDKANVKDNAKIKANVKDNANANFNKAGTKTDLAELKKIRKRLTLKSEDRQISTDEDFLTLTNQRKLMSEVLLQVRNRIQPGIEDMPDCQSSFYREFFIPIKG